MKLKRLPEMLGKDRSVNAVQISVLSKAISKQNWKLKMSCEKYVFPLYLRGNLRDTWEKLPEDTLYSL